MDVIWPEFNNTEIDQPQEFSEGVRKYYPKQMLGFNLSPSLYFGKAKKAGTLITNQQLGDLGFILQFSTLFNFRTAGMALEKGLRKFLKSGIEALADLQIEEDGQEASPTTKMHQKFAGMNRWLILEQVLSGRRRVARHAATETQRATANWFSLCPLCSSARSSASGPRRPPQPHSPGRLRPPPRPRP